MSSGQKAWADELEEKARQEHLARIKSIHPANIAYDMRNAHEALARFMSSNPALTKYQWSLLDSVLTILRSYQ